MAFTRTYSFKFAVRVVRIELLLLALAFVGGVLISPVDAQSHSVDGTFLVAATLDGTPAILVLDTGAEHSLLDQEFAHRLGLRSVGVANLQKLYSAEATEIVSVKEFDVESVHSSDLMLMTANLTASSRAIGEHIDGVLGNDFLRRFTVTLDYSAGSVTFDETPVAHHGVPMKLRRLGDRYFVLVNLDDVPLSLLVDTGTNFSALSPNGWTRLDKGKRPFLPIEGVRSSETSATSKLICVHRMTIGKTSYHDLPMRVLPSMSAGFLADPNVDGVLGSDFFRRFVVVLDLANDSLYLTPDRRFKIDQDRFSTIGIQFAKNSAGSFTVMAVWSPTPASEANLKVGDQVLFVDGSSTIAMTQEDLSRQLHGEPGRQVQIGLISGGDQRTVRLTIRNLLCQSSVTVAR
jgi:hypothetical protein